MTQDEMCAFRGDLELLANKYKLPGDHDIERILNGISDCIEEEIKYQTHPLVISILNGIIEGTRHLAMDYYVSYK